MRWSRPEEGVVELSAGATTVLIREMRLAPLGPERGGVLLGRRIGGSVDIIIDLVQGPIDQDSASSLSFTRSNAHQALVDSAWAASAGTVNYLGDWHTHPQQHPTPSMRDYATWKRLAQEQAAEHLPLFFLIVGGQQVCCWEVFPRDCCCLNSV